MSNRKEMIKSGQTQHTLEYMSADEVSEVERLIDAVVVMLLCCLCDRLPSSLLSFIIRGHMKRHA
jgi:hypothetical protein